jgi:arsenite methyltransferase
MNTNEEIKKIVKEKYSQIAMSPKNKSGCCGNRGSSVDYSVFSEDYKQAGGYMEEADLGLGCGLPVDFAGIKPGNIIVDLGSGAGNDCFVARAETGVTGKVIGVDFSPEMIEKAKGNAAKLRYNNVEFIFGDIENIPLPGNHADVVVSNCVLNLVPDKNKAFSEIFRILKPGGHFSISDVVVVGQLPAETQRSVELYAGCVTGAIDRNDYINKVTKAGFVNIEIQKERQLEISDEVLKNHLDKTTYDEFRASVTGIFSITIYGKKPAN